MPEEKFQHSILVQLRAFQALRRLSEEGRAGLKLISVLFHTEISLIQGMLRVNRNLVRNMGYWEPLASGFVNGDEMTFRSSASMRMEPFTSEALSSDRALAGIWRRSRLPGLKVAEAEDLASVLSDAIGDEGFEMGADCCWPLSEAPPNLPKSRAASIHSATTSWFS